MAKSTKSYEERMLEMEKKEQESLEKAKRYAAQKKELLKRKKTEEQHRLTNPIRFNLALFNHFRSLPHYILHLIQIAYQSQ